MRGPTREELQKTPPPALRMGSKTTQAYLEMRRKILAGEYTANQVIIPKQIEEEHHVNNTTTQVLLARLANEGLIQVLPIKVRSWPQNASLNEYRVADFTNAQKILMERQDAVCSDMARGEEAKPRHGGFTDPGSDDDRCPLHHDGGRIVLFSEQIIVIGGVYPVA